MKIVKKKETYNCVRKKQDCKLGTGKRTMCSYCRYRKCIEVGMSQDGNIVTLKYINHIFVSTKTEVQKKSVKIPKGDNPKS